MFNTYAVQDVALLRTKIVIVADEKRYPLDDMANY